MKPMYVPPFQDRLLRGSRLCSPPPPTPAFTSARTPFTPIQGLVLGQFRNCDYQFLSKNQFIYRVGHPLG